MRLVSRTERGGVSNGSDGIEDNDDINEMGGYLVPDPNEVERVKITEAQRVLRATADRMSDAQA